MPCEQQRASSASWSIDYFQKDLTGKGRSRIIFSSLLVVHGVFCPLALPRSPLALPRSPLFVHSFFVLDAVFRPPCFFFRGKKTWQIPEKNRKKKHTVFMSLKHTEYIDPQGLRVVRQLLTEFDESTLDSKERKRLRFLLQYIDAVDVIYGPEIVGPIGLCARPLVCEYRRVRSGRLYCRTRQGPQWSQSESSYICAQGMPNVLRPYLMQKWGHDLDIENCHVALMYQLGSSYPEWPEHEHQSVCSLTLTAMKALYEDRETFIDGVADFHLIAKDADRHPGYRKELIKPLLLRILYGGSYEMWLKENEMDTGNKCPQLTQLECELRNLRIIVIQSKRFETLVQQERKAQELRNRSRGAADRGVFSKIAQHLECEVLLAMRQYLMRQGWEVHSLIFDGLIVGHRPNIQLDLHKIERHVKKITQFVVRIVEKPLYLHMPTSRKLLQ